jgi:hypothetical protein
MAELAVVCWRSMERGGAGGGLGAFGLLKAWSRCIRQRGTQNPLRRRVDLRSARKRGAYGWRGRAGSGVAARAALCEGEKLRSARKRAAYGWRKSRIA